MLLLIKHSVDIYTCNDINESVSDVYGRDARIIDEDDDDDEIPLPDATRLEHVATIEDAYRRESNWRRHKEYAMFAHSMMHMNDNDSVEDAHMIKVHIVFGMRHIHEWII